MNEFTPDFFEEVIVKYLVTKSMVREKLLPYLDDVKIFHTPEVRTIIKKISYLQEKYKDFPPPSTIKMELNTTEVQDKFNTCLKLDTSEFNEDHLLGKIEEFFKQGKLYNLLTDAVTQMQEGKFDEMAEVTNEMREALSFSFDTECGLNLFDDKSIDIMWDHFHNKDNIISSGITALDECIEGGFHEKSLSIFAAQSNLGKSAILCALAANALMSGKKVIYITLEMAANKIAERILANLFGIAINDIKNLSKETFKSKYAGIIAKVNANLIIKEFPARSMNANHLLALHKELEIKQNFKSEIDFIDYIGLMVPIRLKKDENTYSEQKRCSEEVRAAAMELSLPLVSAYQVNRGSFGSTSVGMEGISDSIGIVFTVDLLIMVTQSIEQKDAGLMSWTIVKSRYGQNNIRITVGIDMPKMTLINIENAIEDLNKDIDDPDRGGTDASDTLQNFLQARKRTF